MSALIKIQCMLNELIPGNASLHESACMHTWLQPLNHYIMQEKPAHLHVYAFACMHHWQNTTMPALTISIYIVGSMQFTWLDSPRILYIYPCMQSLILFPHHSPYPFPLSRGIHTCCHEALVYIGHQCNRPRVVHYI